MNKLITVGVLGLALVGASLSVAAPAQAAPHDRAPVSSKSLISHNLIVKHSATKGDKKTLGICDHWTSPEVSTYHCDGITGTLAHGEDSKTKYGWNDTDAIKVNAHYYLKRQVVGVDDLIASCSSRTRYVKVRPRPFDHKDVFYLKECN